jgi:IclR family mhp operon transcriptional activator
MMGIARRELLPYPTACRIVQTLLHEGLIEQEPARKRYRPTALVQSLAQGFKTGSQLVSVARPHIKQILRRLSPWANDTSRSERDRSGLSRVLAGARI